jgi:uncharacterized coiled-coil protein SlyX
MKLVLIAVSAVLMSSTMGCASHSQQEVNTGKIGYLERQNKKQWEEIEALRNQSAEQERAIERVRTLSLNLDTEAKRLRKVLCEKHPEDCPPSVLDR